MISVHKTAVASLAFLAGIWLGQTLSADSAAEPDKPRELAAALVRADEAAVTNGNWGHWLRYFRGDTHGSQDLVVLAVTLKPGEAPHAPHQHAEEELMILGTGSGRWRLGEKELDAKAGDAVYAAPWTMHGIKNTGDQPLTYYMVKWSGKGVAAPERPSG